MENDIIPAAGILKMTFIKWLF